VAILKEDNFRAMGSILERIKIIAEAEGITVTAMETKIGASKGVLSRALTRHTDIQSKWLQAIAEIYHRYSAEWILRGTGNMLKEKTTAGVEEEKKEVSIAPEVDSSSNFLEVITALARENGKLEEQVKHRTAEKEWISGKLDEFVIENDELKKEVARLTAENAALKNKGERVVRSPGDLLHLDRSTIKEKTPLLNMSITG
jgi:hypothetical protein